MSEHALRDHLRRLLTEEQAHVSFEAAVTHLPAERAGEVPDGWAWSAWQLLEHVRIAEEDLLRYCVDPDYQSPQWPEDYWPNDPEPPRIDDWERSVQSFRDTRRELVKLLDDPARSLFDTVPTSGEHTILRAVLLVVDHTAYHTGQMVALRRALGMWPS